MTIFEQCYSALFYIGGYLAFEASLSRYTVTAQAGWCRFDEAIAFWPCLFKQTAKYTQEEFIDKNNNFNNFALSN